MTCTLYNWLCFPTETITVGIFLINQNVVLFMNEVHIPQVKAFGIKTQFLFKAVHIVIFYVRLQKCQCTRVIHFINIRKWNNILVCNTMQSSAQSVSLKIFISLLVYVCVQIRVWERFFIEFDVYYFIQKGFNTLELLSKQGLSSPIKEIDSSMSRNLWTKLFNRFSLYNNNLNSLQTL